MVEENLTPPVTKPEKATNWFNQFEIPEFKELLKELSAEYGNVFEFQGRKEDSLAHVRAGLTRLEKAVEQDELLVEDIGSEGISIAALTREAYRQLKTIFDSYPHLEAVITGGFSRSGKTVLLQILDRYINAAGGNSVFVDCQSIGEDNPPDVFLFSALNEILRLQEKKGNLDKPLDIIFIDEMSVLRKMDKPNFTVAHLIAHLHKVFPWSYIVSTDVFYRNWRDKEFSDNQVGLVGAKDGFLYPRHFLSPTVNRLKESGLAVAGVELKDSWDLKSIEILLRSFCEKGIDREMVETDARELFAVSGGNVFVAKTIIERYRARKKGNLTGLELKDLTGKLSQIIPRLRQTDLFDWDIQERIFKDHGFPGAYQVAESIFFSFSGYPDQLLARKHRAAALGYSRFVVPDLSILGIGKNQGIFFE